jgi:hypothetical protein
MNNGPTLSIGSTGHDVRRLQRIFVMTKALAPTGITGSFDATTEQAVKDFQQGAGLIVDGIVGPQTWQALPADPNTPVPVARRVGRRCDWFAKRSQEVFNSRNRSGARGRCFRSQDRSRCESLPRGSSCPRGWNCWRSNVVGSRRCCRGYSCFAIRTYDSVI